MRDYDEMSARKKQILRMIIEAHISAGEPVGSKYLTGEGGIGFSSATIRNEMAELEDMGYLEQPHTSAGRVPTRLGYRFYVDQLVSSYRMTRDEISELNRLLESKVRELDTILMKASRLAASMTNYTSITVKAAQHDATVAKFSALSLDSHNFLLVVQTEAGEVKTRHLSVGFPVYPETVDRIAATLNGNLAGVPVGEITLPKILRMESELPGYEALVSPIVREIYSILGEGQKDEVEVEGLEKLLMYPELSNAEDLSSVLGLLKGKDKLVKIVNDADKQKVNVFMGSEAVDIGSNSTLVFKPLTKNGRTIGAIGVIGPRRMAYSRVMSTIEYLSDRINRIVNEEDKEE